MSTAAPHIYLVAGATGTIGRLVVDELLRSGHKVRALTRSRSDAVLPAGVEIIAGDLDRPNDLAGALRGVVAAHLITHSGPAYAPLQAGEQLIEQIESAGVRRVSILWRGVAGAVERAASASTLEWTRLQPVEYMSNARFWGASIKAGEPLEVPHANTSAALVHPVDVAAVAARVLVEGGHHGQVYSITGPQGLTVRQRLDAIGQRLGRQLDLRELSRREARARWRAVGFSDEQIANLENFDRSEAARTVTDVVARVTGRRPRSFDTWVDENLEAFR